MLDLIEWIAKAAVGLGSIKVFLAGIYKPFMEWRRKLVAQTVREVLAPELKQLQDIIAEESGCAESLKITARSMHEMFNDLDKMLVIATDNRARIDETNDLLDEVFNLDRRIDHERAAEIDALLTGLAERQKLRRRGVALLVIEEPKEPA
jgi:hypothetical protein